MLDVLVPGLLDRDALEDGSKHCRNPRTDNDSQCAVTQPSKTLTNEDAHVQEDDGYLVEGYHDLVWRLCDPEELEACLQLMLGEVDFVLAIAVDYCELDVNGQDDGENLESLQY
jgi:hypothetical protein